LARSPIAFSTASIASVIVLMMIGFSVRGTACPYLRSNVDRTSCSRFPKKPNSTTSPSDANRDEQLGEGRENARCQGSLDAQPRWGRWRCSCRSLTLGFLSRRCDLGRSLVADPTMHYRVRKTSGQETRPLDNDL
jgi:hypothetical protein